MAQHIEEFSLTIYNGADGLEKTQHFVSFKGDVLYFPAGHFNFLLKSLNKAYTLIHFFPDCTANRKASFCFYYLVDGTLNKDWVFITLNHLGVKGICYGFRKEHLKDVFINIMLKPKKELIA